VLKFNEFNENTNKNILLFIIIIVIKLNLFDENARIITTIHVKNNTLC
jgi:hypothetical protein